MFNDNFMSSVKVIEITRKWGLKNEDSSTFVSDPPTHHPKVDKKKIKEMGFKMSFEPEQISFSIQNKNTSDNEQASTTQSVAKMPIDTHSWGRAAQ